MTLSSKLSERQQIDRRLQANLLSSSRRRRSFEALVFCNQRLFWTQASEATKRIFDLLVASAIVALLSPVLLMISLAAHLTGGGLRRTKRLGRAGKVFGEYSFQFGSAGSKSIWYRTGLHKLPILLNVVRGDMSLVGPRPFAPGEVGSSDRFAWRRFDVRPGLICLWWIRKRANIDYRTETEIDAEYVDGLCATQDLGIMLRSIPASLYGKNTALRDGTCHILGITIDNLTLKEAVNRIVGYAHESTPKQVCFVNADCVNIAFRDADYKEVVATSELVLADGIGMKLAGKLLKMPICQNVNGTDLLPELCGQLAGLKKKLYLLGGKPGVASDVAAWIAGKYPDAVVGGYRDGYFTERDLPNVLKEIRDSRSHIILVAMGAPKQEKWIADFLPQTGCMVGIGVGGLFDFYAGRIPRAPIWVREIGMEWFFRFIQEPRRMWKRYIAGNFLFLARVLLARWA